MKRRLWIVLCLALIGTVLLCAAASAETKSGTCGANGNNVTWTLTDDGVLTISGTGAMADFVFDGTEDTISWLEMISNDTHQINIEAGITHIGNSAFCQFAFESDGSVSIPNTVTSIGDNAFSLSGLRSITLPESVKSIGTAAFRLSHLTSVNIPYGVTSIPSMAFSQCLALTDVTIPETVTSIGNDAFVECPLVHIEIPQGVTVIGSSAFLDCSSLTSVSIPETVTTIGEKAFADCSSLTRIVIPSTVTSIGENAFMGCDDLTVHCAQGSAAHTYCVENDIPYTLTSGSGFCGVIGDNLTWTLNDGVLTISGTGLMADYPYPDDDAPWGTDIQRVVVENGVTSLGERAFANCSSLTSVSLPATLVSIGSEAFLGCSRLTGITIPSSVSIICCGAFRASGLTSVSIPSSVVWIDNSAFENCDSLASVTFANSVTGVSTWTDLAGQGSLHLGNSIFLGCDRLTAITLPGTVNSIGAEAFCNSGLASIVIPDSVTSIGDTAFSGCYNLTGVTLPNHLTEIGGSVFASSGLTEITIPGSLSRIPMWAFSDCSDLTTVIIQDGVQSFDMSAFHYCSNLTSVMIPASVTAIDSGSFYGDDNLVITVIPDSAAHNFCIENNIPYQVFQSGTCGANGDNLTWTLDDGVLTISGTGAMADYDAPWSAGDNLVNHPWPASHTQRVVIEEGVASIGKCAFAECSNLSAISIPNTVISIGESAFGVCSSLTAITIPSGVTRIAGFTFEACSSLTNISLPEGLTSIEMGAFWWCESLTSISLPSTLTFLESDAFGNCHSLTSITLPDSLTTLEGTLGSALSALTAIHVSANHPSFASVDGVLYSKDMKTLMICPGGKNDFYNIPGSVTAIGDFAFYGCTNIYYLAVPEKVTSIGAYAFSLCTNLNTLSIPANVTSIGNRAFHGCDSITVECPQGSTAHTYCLDNSIPFKMSSGSCGVDGDNVTWCVSGGGLTISGTGAMMDDPFYTGFEGPWDITWVTVKDGVTHIGKNAFVGYNVFGIVLPASVTSISDHAFDGCNDNDIIYMVQHGSFGETYALGTGKPVIPEGIDSDTLTLPAALTTIDSEAFAGTAAAAAIIPRMVTSIAPDAFADSQVIYILGYEGTAAQTFANGNGFMFVPQYGDSAD